MGPSQEARRHDLPSCDGANSGTSKLARSARAGFLRGSRTMRPVRLVLGAWLAGTLVLAACIDYTVTDPPEEVDLTISEIRAKLQSGSFRDKLAARKQIGKLPAPDRLRVLTALVEDPDLPTRTIAVQELGRMLPDEAARAVLEKVRSDDPDETIRALAGEKLAPASP